MAISCSGAAVTIKDLASPSAEGAASSASASGAPLSPSGALASASADAAASASSWAKTSAECSENKLGLTDTKSERSVLMRSRVILESTLYM